MKMKYTSRTWGWDFRFVNQVLFGKARGRRPSLRYGKAENAAKECLNYESVSQVQVREVYSTSFVICCLLIIGCGNDNNTIDQEESYVLNIEFEGAIPKDEKIDMTLHQTVNDQVTTYYARIERRGGFSISFPKRSYEIDLKEDVSLAGLPEDDDWILNANYIDKTFLRHVMSYELFSSMGDKNITSQNKYVEVELNGVYNGLYVLMEKLDKSSLEIDGDDPMAVIFKEPHIFRESYDGIIPQNMDNFHQQTYPKIKKEDKRPFIEEVRDFIIDTNDEEFINGLPDVFDMENIIDWHLLLLISNNSDGILKNYYLYKIDEETPIRIAPWDYDHSFGRDGDNELNLDERPLDIKRSVLFRRLLEYDWYKEALKARWVELNTSNILSEYGLKQRIVNSSDEIREQAMKNFELWPVDDGTWYYDANNFEEEINIMLRFIELRHGRRDSSIKCVSG